MPAPPPARTVRVNAPSRGYDALVGTGLLGSLGGHVAQLLPRAHRSAVVYDRGAEPHALRAIGALREAGLTPEPVLPLNPGEGAKTLDTTGTILEAMTAARLERGCPLIAIGGGIVGDIAGFAAAVYRRGVPWIDCPTTLLAMVDASIGGKTAVNITAAGGLRKNMAGAFHQPSLVLADTDSLSTLPVREFRCGLAECVKHGMIAGEWADAGLLSWIETKLDKIIAKDPPTLIEMIARNIAVKARVIESDEREEVEGARGGRALLNLGHTFAHALEPLQTLSPDGDPAHAPLHHGEAVALGLIAACACASHPSLHLADAALGRRVRALLDRIGLPTAVASLPPAAQLLADMFHDKKVAAGQLRLVLPVSEGSCSVVPNPPLEAVMAGLDAIRLVPRAPT